MSMNNSRGFIRKILILLLSTCFVFSGNSMYIFADDGEAANSSTDDYQLLLYAVNDEVEYKTGDEPIVYVGVKVTGNDTVLRDAYMIVAVPKEYIDSTYNNKTGINASNSSILKSAPVVTSDDNNYYIRYEYEAIAGGSSVLTPFAFRTTPLTTPNGTTIPITAQLYNGDDEQLLDNNVTITNIAASEPYTSGRNQSFTESVRRTGTTTSTNPDENDVVYVGSSLYRGGDTTSDLGVFIPSKVKITATLADGVVLDDECIAKNEEEGWTYDAETRTLTKIRNPHTTVGTGSINGNIYLKMPGFTYNKYHTVYTTTAVALDADGNEIGPVSSPVASTIRIVPKPEVKGYINISKKSSGDYLYTEENKDKITTWDISYNIADNEEYLDEMYVNTINDDLSNSDSKHLYYYSYRLDAENSVLEDGTDLTKNKVYATTKSGNRVLIGTNVPVNEDILIEEDNHLSNTDVYRKIEIEFEDGVRIIKGKNTLKWTVKTKVFEDDYDDGEAAETNGFLGRGMSVLNTYLYNYAGVSASGSNENASAKFSGRAWSNYRINNGVAVHLASTTDKVTGMIDEISKVTTSLNLSGYRQVTEDGYDVHLKNGKLVILLPNGWEYINDNDYPTQLMYQAWDETDSKGYTNKTVDINPEIQYDYCGTGQRALVIDIPSDYRSQDGSLNQMYTGSGFKANSISVALNLKRTTNTPSGASTVNSYLTWDNNGKNQMKLWSTNMAYTDEYDFDKDGNTTETFAQSSVTLRYAPPEETAGILKVGTTLDNLNTSSSSILDIGDDFMYEVDVVNNSRETVRSMDLIDILPFKGDKAIIANKEGEYVDRGSEYTVEMTGAIKFLKDGELVDPAENGYTVTYSTDAVTNGDIDANLGATFVSASEITDWSKVTMFRITMNDGTTIEKTDSVKFIVPTKVADDVENIQNGDIAYNSFALATSGDSNVSFNSLAYLEAVKVVTPVARYTVTGTVYRDFNYDKSLTDKEFGLEGIKLGLYNSDGVKVDETTTDEDGYYEFIVTDRGDYTVKVIEKPSKYEFDAGVDPSETFTSAETDGVKIKVNNLEVDNDVDGNGASASFTLNPENLTAVVNAALQEKTIEIPVEKVWDDPANVTSIDVTLHAAGVDETKTISLTESGNWKGSFDNILKYDESGEEIAYTLTEDTEITGFTSDVTGSASDGFTVTNTATRTPVSIKFSGTKTIDGDEDITGGSKEVFKFNLKETTSGADYEDSTTVTGEGKFSFKSIEYTMPGTHTYEITEAKGSADGYDYAKTKYEVTVVVEKSGSTELSATITGLNEDGSGADFENSYKADPTSVIFSGVKILKTIAGDEKTLSSGDYTFVLADKESGDEIESVSNDADGNFAFSKITYNKVGTYTYTISEKDEKAGGYTYDDTVYDVTVKVTDDGSGKLAATITGLNKDGSGADFENSYKADPTSVTFSGVKTLKTIAGDEKTLSAGEYTFVLADKENGDEIESVSNDADGNFAFTEITYDNVGTHTYTISEKAGEAGGYIYDDTVYDVTVKVTDDGNGKLIATITGLNEDGSGADFENSYKADSTAVTFSGIKTMTGDKKTLNAGDFTFTLIDKESGDEIESVSNDADGNFAFTEITYDNVGTFSYTISEVAGDATGITYDDTVYEVTVEVTDDGNGNLVATISGLNEDGTGAYFENKYTAPKTGGDGSDSDSSRGVKTGDSNSILVYAALLLAALEALAIIIKKRRAQ